MCELLARKQARAAASKLAAKLRLAQQQDRCADEAAAFGLTDGVREVEIFSIGDCHGGRTTRLLSDPSPPAHFYGGCIYSWISGRRGLPPLAGLLRGRPRAPKASGTAADEAPSPSAAEASPSLPPPPRLAVVIFSYGEIDCRCHAPKWADDGDALAQPYVSKIREWVADGVAAW